MSKLLSNISIVCAILLCGIYAYKSYMGEQVAAIAALIPWVLCLANDIVLRADKQ